MKRSLIFMFAAFAMLAAISCSNNEQLAESSPKQKSAQEFSKALEQLELEIIAKLDCSATRGENIEEPKERADTAKVVLADVHGAVSGARDGLKIGSKFSGWGAVIGGVVGAILEGALESFLASKMVLDGVECYTEVERDSLLFAEQVDFDNLVFLCYRLTDSLTTNEGTTLMSMTVSDRARTVGVIHNKMLEGIIERREVHPLHLNRLEETIMDSIKVKCMNTVGLHAMTDSVEGLNNEERVVVNSFSNMMRYYVTSPLDKQMVINSYRTFVADNIVDQSSQMKVLTAIEVADNSYDYWHQIIEN